MGEAEGRVPPGLPVISKGSWEYRFKDFLQSGATRTLASADLRERIERSARNNVVPKFPQNHFSITYLKDLQKEGPFLKPKISKKHPSGLL